MIFVDTTVFLYAVGRRRIPKHPALLFGGGVAGISARLLAGAKAGDFGCGPTLGSLRCAGDLAIEEEDVYTTRALVDQYPGLGARDLAPCLL